MFIPRLLITVFLLLWISACGTLPSDTTNSLSASPTYMGQETEIIAFGSCLRQWAEQPVWQGVNSVNPKAFIFTGDNVYSDVGPYLQQPLPARIQQAYKDLAFSPEFNAFLQNIEQQNGGIYASWDDHDYGSNDGGAEFAYRAEAKQYFADFFQLDPAAIGSSPELGIYHSNYFTVSGLRVQLLVLDTRSYRSPIKRSVNTRACTPTGIVANRDPEATVLGAAQWAWLANELQQPADIRLLVSSIQVLATEHCFEKWQNFPQERQRLFNVLKGSQANGLILLSGDRHLAEIAKADIGLPYPLYEVTSSGLNSAVGLNSPAANEKNTLRLSAKPILVNNFGSIEIRRNGQHIELALQIRDVNGQVLQETLLDLRSLR